MKVIDARYLNNYTVELIFDDQKRQLIDFLPTLKNNPVCKKYLDLAEFKKFKIEDGNIVWGRNWDMIFTPESLYYNTLNNNI